MLLSVLVTLSQQSGRYAAKHLFVHLDVMNGDDLDTFDNLHLVKRRRAFVEMQVLVPKPLDEATLGILDHANLDEWSASVLRLLGRGVQPAVVDVCCLKYEDVMLGQYITHGAHTSGRWAERLHIRAGGPLWKAPSGDEDEGGGEDEKQGEDDDATSEADLFCKGVPHDDEDPCFGTRLFLLTSQQYKITCT